MGNFVKHRVGKESVEGDVLSLLFHNQELGDRHQNPIVLCPHRVFELQPTRTLCQLNFWIVRKIDRNRFRTRIAIARVVDHVVRIEV